MTGAMYAAVAGLKTHMSALNVIGNNIANVNTNAYKSSRYTFEEALYTSQRSGSNGTTTKGGRNPAQIGYGCSVATIDMDMSTKSYNPTGRALDCMVDGDGFFIVGDKLDMGDDGTTPVGIVNQSQLQGMRLTRHGDFKFIDGYLVDGLGEVVYGYPVISAGDDTNPTEGADGLAFNYDYGTVLAPIRLPRVTGEGINSEVVYPRYSEEDDEGGRALTYEDAFVEAEGGGREEMPVPVLDSISIDQNSGRISATTEDGIVMVIGYLAIGKADNPEGVTHIDGRYYQAMDGAGNLHATSLDVDLCERTWNTEDGNEEYTGLPIESSGKTGIVPNGLEQSGTDLATEISNMIMMQRGYQANTRIVTVTDSMLEELVNMKRG